MNDLIQNVWRIIHIPTVKWLSLLTMVIVAFSLSTVFLLAVYHSCEQISFAGVVCEDPTNQQMGQVAMMITWATFYTLLPAVLTVIGVYHLVLGMWESEQARHAAKKKP